MYIVLKRTSARTILSHLYTQSTLIVPVESWKGILLLISTLIYQLSIVIFIVTMSATSITIVHYKDKWIYLVCEKAVVAASLA